MGEQIKMIRLELECEVTEKMYMVYYRDQCFKFGILKRQI